MMAHLLSNGMITLGGFAQFSSNAFGATRGFWRRRKLFFDQCLFTGVSSTGIIVVAGIFLGAVMGYQLYVSLHLFGAEALLGGSVGVALFRELGPVMTAIMVTGRSGAAMAAQLASMRVSEQIDALEVMAVDPLEYLVVPRVAAGCLMMPILGVLFSAVASVSAAWIACGVMDLSYSTYWSQFSRMVDTIELVHCIIKSAAFGLVITMVACFCGFRARGGARAVGQATRNTVVASCLTILLTDYILTSLLPFGHSGFKSN